MNKWVQDGDRSEEMGNNRTKYANILKGIFIIMVKNNEITQ